MSESVYVFLRAFWLPLLLVAAYLLAFGVPGGHTKVLQTAVDAYTANLTQKLGIGDLGTQP
jgi:hypothetical protein